MVLELKVGGNKNRDCMSQAPKVLMINDRDSLC